jgi:NAD(P)-dependent dehydrogenase (short-subunit alcohol dehydrogenase family)
MDELAGRVAVVTGAASGIGRALAERWAAEGMRVVMADIEKEPLAEAADALRDKGSDVLAVPTDVSDGAQVDALAEAARDAYGGVHVLCNNAGVAMGGPVAELTTEDWEWVLGVNLWGVVHGLRAFLPGMLASGEEGHVVNTASVAGLLGAGWMAPYAASKYAVVGISECLYHELMPTRVGISVLCPSWVNTNIHRSFRNRPAHLGGGRRDNEGGPLTEALAQLLAAGLAPETVADHVADAVRRRRFWVLTHPDVLPVLQARTAGIVAGENPRPLVLPS